MLPWIPDRCTVLYILQGCGTKHMIGSHSNVPTAYPLTYIVTYIPHSSLRSDCCVESKAYFIFGFTSCQNAKRVITEHWPQSLTPVSEPNHWTQSLNQVTDPSCWTQSLLMTSLIMVRWYSCLGRMELTWLLDPCHWFLILLYLLCGEVVQTLLIWELCLLYVTVY